MATLITEDCKKIAARARLVLLVLLALILFASPVSVQAQGPAETQQSSSEATENNRKTGAADAVNSQKISPAEAEELFRSVDEILRFASKDTGLPIKHEVKRRLTSREEVVAYLEKNIAEDKDAQRLHRSELVLKKFGLLPRDFDLHSFLVKLLKEQVAGYYDPKTKTVNLLDWLEASQQRPVLAHELTHALQDQSFGLKKWMQAGAADLTEKKDPTSADIENDEINESRQAVVEGQAMGVLLDYMLAPTRRSLTDSPQLLETMKAAMLEGAADAPEFRDAPIFLRESLTFPYRYGTDFVADVMRKRGKAGTSAIFTNPPRNTRQIMEPDTYLSDEQIPPMPLPDFKQVFRDYDRFDIGAIGEFDVSVLLDQYAGTDVSRKLYPHWRGGYYYAARPKSGSDASLGLLYVSRWSDSASASSFAATYAKALLKRYQRVQEATSEGSKPEVDLNAVANLTGSHAWMTEEGPVFIEVNNDTVLVTESLSQAITEKLEQALFTPAAK